MMRYVVLALLVSTLCACSGLSIYRADPVARHLSESPPGESARCANLFAELDDVIDQQGTRDARATRLPGYPYLRSDRLLAALVRDVRDQESLNAWVRLAATLDEESRRNEIAQLPDAALPPTLGSNRDAIEATLRRCRVQMAGADLADIGAVARLREAAQVPAEYQHWKRALGLYPLTRIAFARGVRQWQAATEAVFNTPLANLPRRGRPVVYVPPLRRHAAGEFDALFGDKARNSLGLYEWDDDQREALFALYAPRILIDEATHDDRLGALEYDVEARLWVNIFRPVVYRRLTHTFMDGRWLPQFVYSFWFPARSAEPGIDLLAGKLDGLIWRVTVGSDGHPLAYDSIHPCGCYHLFFPTEAVRARPQPESLDETLFAPQSLPRIRAGESLVLHLEAGTHYLRRVSHQGVAPDAHLYEFAEDDELRSLRLPASEPGGAARRSAFGPDGIIAGTERAERFLFWPMGVDNAGAMRQWGRHATAFVGERHFDDADLFERYFEVLQ
ncbi:MAG: hypothetical protein ACKVQK_23475 [Burkholderiales bacterium]